MDACICRRDPLSYALSCCTCRDPLVARRSFFLLRCRSRDPGCHRQCSRFARWRDEARAASRSDAVFAGREKTRVTRHCELPTDTAFFHMRFSTDHVRQKGSSSQTLSVSCVFLASGGNQGEQRFLICQRTRCQQQDGAGEIDASCLGLQPHQLLCRYTHGMRFHRQGLLVP